MSSGSGQAQLERDADATSDPGSDVDNAAASERAARLAAQKRQTGTSQRRAGRKGDSAFRAALRTASARREAAVSAELVESSDGEAADAEPQQQQLALARLARHLGAAETETSLDVASEASASFYSSPAVSQTFQAGDQVQQQLLLLAVAAKGKGLLVRTGSASQPGTQPASIPASARLVYDSTQRLLFNAERRRTSSLTAEAELLQMKHTTLQEHVQATAAAVQDASCNSWAFFLAWLQQEASDGRLRLQCLVRTRCYDETPLRFRINERHGDKKTTSVVKVLQTMFSLGL
eukprot:s381_g2.t1